MSSIAEQVGRVVGGRYRLLAPVGSGASSQVFEAVDTRLGRRVAVKLLHPMLATDAAFLRRFRAEARLAASLDHPHVMRVFDWGEEQGGPYLVLEFLAGGSLRSLLDTGVRLSHSQAALLGSQAGAGLCYAHRRGIVHRDIKPGNLLFDEEGHIRIADFGVARALAEAALTEPLGAIFGTARYASPEQAEGRALDDRTDVYSLALVLYETLTGRVPFTRDTVSATLMARMGATLPPAKELGLLGPILAQAAISEPLARLDAAMVAAELDALLRELPLPAPLPLERVQLKATSGGRDPLDPTEVEASGPPDPRAGLGDLTMLADTNGQPGAVGAATTFGPPGAEARFATDPAAPRVPPPALPPQVVSVPGMPIVQPGSRPPSGPPSSPGPPPPPGPPAVAASQHPARRPARRRRWIRAGILTVVLAVLAGAATAGFVVTRNDRRTVPRLFALTLAEAGAVAKKAGLRVEAAGSQPSFKVPEGHVIDQSVSPGRQLRPEALVRVVLSSGLPFVKVPLERHHSLAAALAGLKNAHLDGVVSAKAYSEKVPVGSVISQRPVGGQQRFGSRVSLVVSKGPHPRLIPDLGHGSYASAAAALTQLQLNPVEHEEHSTTWPLGEVIDSSPAAGQRVPRGMTVVVNVSSGPPTVAVPVIHAGESLHRAEIALQNAGLVPVVYGVGRTVVTTYPSSDATVPVGSQVVIYTI